ncbi:hypothetical protein [Pseudarthrobacter sp. N5]|uniref:hypothetical protein n=1 Tax=Pseudarthrobacter sp. N5 TaxID=3418416 RepID=UPI003CE9A45F
MGVPDPTAPQTIPSAPALATPTVTPGHDATAVAAKDMPFSAGGLLAQGVPVGISDGLRGAPGWKMVKENMAGENRYLKADGCMAATRISLGQWPLVAGDDKDSTEALFGYLDSSILPGYLKTATLRWGGDADKSGPSVEVLVLERPVTAGARAASIMARLFSKAGSSVYISVSCPDTSALAAARADVAQMLILVPPSN